MGVLRIKKKIYTFSKKENQQNFAIADSKRGLIEGEVKRELAGVISIKGEKIEGSKNNFGINEITYQRNEFSEEIKGRDGLINSFVSVQVMYLRSICCLLESKVYKPANLSDRIRWHYGRP